MRFCYISLFQQGTLPQLWMEIHIENNLYCFACFIADFNMSDAQKEHASTVERLAPSLADLRVKLQDYMSEEQFWIIYFILLLPRLSEYDFELLSTSKARFCSLCCLLFLFNCICIHYKLKYNLLLANPWVDWSWAWNDVALPFMAWKWSHGLLSDFSAQNHVN